MFSFICISFEIISNPNKLMRASISLALVEWGSAYKNSKNKTILPRKLKQIDYGIDGQKSIVFFSTKGSHICRKLLELKSLVNIMMIYQPVNLELIKPKDYWWKSTTKRLSAKTLNLMWKNVIFIWLQKQLDISFMVIFNYCQYQLIDEKTSWWILLLD